MDPSNQPSSPPSTPPQTAPARESVDYTPATLSRLRESHNASAEDVSISNPSETEQVEERRSLGGRIFGIFRGGLQQQAPTQSTRGNGEEEVLSTGQMHEHTPLQPDARTRLLDSYNREYACGTTDCGHGTFSPKASPSSDASSISSFPGDAGNTGDGPSGRRTPTFVTASSGQGSNEERGMSTTKMLAQKHGVKNTRRM
jgi:hypothetical protein